MRRLLAILILLCLTLPARADITTNLVAWWKLDETSGTSAADSSGSGYTGTYVNSPTLNVTGAWSGGRAVTFSSASSQAVSTPAINLSATSAVTVAFWAKTSSTSGNVFEASTNYNSFSDSFCILLTGSNAIQAAIKGNGGYNTAELTTTLDGSWKHFCFVFDTSQSAANEVLIYIDGAVTSPTKAFSVNNTNNFGNRAVYIASRAASSVFLNGTMDDVRVYTRALSASDVSQLYYSRGVVFPRSRLVNDGGTAPSQTKAVLVNR